MKIQAYKIDADGFVLETIVVNSTDELESGVVVDAMPNGFYKPRYVNSEWVEGASNEYIDEIKNTPIEPSYEDYLLDLEMRLTLLELGMTPGPKGE